MKHLTIYIVFSFYLLLLVSCYLLLLAPVHAAIPTATPSASSKSVDKEINDLKDRIASKVAQLKLVERRGMFGKVTEATNSQITIIDPSNNTRFIDVDELTKFSSPSAKESFGISDISKGTTLGILGLYNKQSQRLLARFINVLTNNQVIHGAVASIDKADFSFKLITSDKDQYTIDVENITKTLSFLKDSGTVKSGFSKIKVDERVMVAGYPDKKNPTHITATRIILFPEIPKNPKIANVLSSPAPQQISTSTGSAAKVTPAR